jgi:ATP-dependent protease Clp ATPase subunit
MSNERCSFCNKSKDESKVLIRGNHDTKAYICEKCIIKFRAQIYKEKST